MIHYILQIVAYQLLFLAVYDLFLKKETFFHWNRMYLLLTPVVSFLLPFIRIDAIQQRIPEEYIIQLPAVILGKIAASDMVASQMSLEEISLTSQVLQGNYFWETLWVLGAFVSLAVFCYKLIKIKRLRASGSELRLDTMTMVTLPKSDAAFSFFKTVFIGEELSEVQRESILLHEHIHVREGHSYDLLFFEALRIICWFNPLIYIYQKRITALQEFTADAKAAAQDGKQNYYQKLLSQVFQTESISFINTFFNHSLIKNRILMLQKSKSKKIVQLKYLLLVPIIGAALIYTSCTQETNAQAEGSDTANQIMTNKSDILQDIEDLKESIAAKGDLTSEEEKALGALFVLTQKDGFTGKAFERYKDAVDVPFAVIDKVPTYPNCSGDNEALKACMTKEIAAYVGANFNTKLAKDVDLVGRQRIAVQFKIDNEGRVKDVAARAPHPNLEAEAIRVVKGLPNMLPGEHKGKKVGVLYALPIIFEISE